MPNFDNELSRFSKDHFLNLIQVMCVQVLKVVVLYKKVNALAINKKTA